MAVAKRIQNTKGQSLVEYLIIVAIVGVGTMGIMRLVGQNIEIKFANVARALAGKNTTEIEGKDPSADLYAKKDLSNFMKNAVSEDKGSSSGSNHGSSKDQTTE